LANPTLFVESDVHWHLRNWRFCSADISTRVLRYQ
jgi:hypothetical protein